MVDPNRGNPAGGERAATLEHDRTDIRKRGLRELDHRLPLATGAAAEELDRACTGLVVTGDSGADPRDREPIGTWRGYAAGGRHREPAARVND